MASIESTQPRQVLPQTLGVRANALLNKLIETVVMVLISVNVIVVFLQVIYRYVLNNPLSWSSELSRILLMWITFLGASLSVRDGGEIAVDTFLLLIPKRIQMHVRVLVKLASLMIIAILVRASMQLFLSTQNIKTVALGIPTGYLYLSFTIGGSLMMIYFIYNIGRDFSASPSTIITTGIAAIILLISSLFLGEALKNFVTSNLLIVIIVAIPIFLLAGQPIAIIMLIGSLIVIWSKKEIPLLIIPQRLIQGVDNFPLLAIPFFMLAGQLMTSSGITQRLVDFASNLIGHIRGGLSHVAVIVNMIMGGMSGSVLADVSATGSVLIPAMAQKGYDKGFACSLIGAAGTVGSLVPPSIAFIIYGVLGGVSITRLFFAGLIPALLMMFFLMVTGYIVSKKRGYPKEKRPTLKSLYQSFKEAALALVLPLIIMGGILSGVFTPTEASVVAVVYAFIIGWLYYKGLNLKKLKLLLTDTAVKVSCVMFIIAAASGVSWLIARGQGTSITIQYLESITKNPWVLLLLINVLLLILGCLMETISIAIIMIPLVVPLVARYGIDPVQYGVVQTLNLQIGLITPPVGMSMFLVCKLGEISIMDFVKEVYPFFIALLLDLALITYIPALTLFLPKLFMGG